MSVLQIRQQKQLLSRCSSSRLAMFSPACCSHIRPVNALSARSGRCVAGAGARPGAPSGRSNAAAQQQRSGNQSHQDKLADVSQLAPNQQGSALKKAITSSIKQISNDSPAGLQQLEDIVDQWGSSFDYIHASAAFVKAGSITHAQPAAATRLLDVLGGIWDRLLPDAGSQGLANVLWACGKLRYHHPQLWSSTLDAFLRQQDQQNEYAAQHIANVLHGLANAATANHGEVPGISREDVEAAVCQLLEQMRIKVMHPLLEGVKPQGISNTFWACAKLRINPGDAALNSLLQAMSRPAMMEAAGPQDLANSLWAASELRQQCGWQPQVNSRVWQRLLGEQQLRSTADRGTPQDVVNIPLALARLSLPTVGAASADGVISLDFAQQCVLQMLKGKVAKRIEAWEARHISIVMWACSKLRVFDAEMLDRAAAASPSWLRGAITPDIVQVAYACRVLQYRQPQLMAGVVARSKQLQKQHKADATRQRLRGMNLAAVVGDAVAALDMQQLAGGVKELVANTGVAANSRLGPADTGRLWDVHTWLVQHQLLDGQGLAELLSEQQLAEGRKAADDHHLKEERYVVNNAG